MKILLIIIIALLSSVAINATKPTKSSAKPPKDASKNESPAKRARTAASKFLEVDLYGKKIKLSTILDAGNPDVINKVYAKKKILSIVDRDPSTGNLEVKCAGIEYIDRVYKLPNNVLDVISHSPDTPSGIASKLIQKNQNDAIAIVGGPKSGRTVALTKVLNMLRSNPEQSWPILIDAYQAVPNQPPADWVPQDMFSHVLEQNSNLLFNEVLNRNPTKVNFLIDNIDRLQPSIQVKLAHYLLDLQKAGAGVVFTSTNIDLLNVLVKPENTLRIPQLNSHETELYLTRQWDRTLNPADHRAHMEYAKATSAVLEKTPLFKNFGTMEQLSESLSTIKEGYSFNGRDMRYFHKILSEPNEFISVEKYAKLEVSNPMKVIKNLNEAMFNKFRLTERLISPLTKSPHNTFGLEAIEVMRTSKQGASTAQQVRQLGTNRYFPRDVVQHSDHANYFIAQHFIEYVQQFETRFFAADSTVPVEAGANVCERTIKLMVDPEYVNIIEYMNSAQQDPACPTRFKSVFKYLMLVKNEVMQQNLMDNLISNGFDELASTLFKIVGTSKISEYLQNSLTRSDRKMLESTTEYKLGMLTEAETPIRANRQEMIFRKGMVKTIKQLAQFEEPRSNAEYTMWRPNEFTEYLNDFFLRQSHPNEEIYTTMREYEAAAGFSSLSEEVANSRLSNIIEHGDMRSRAIMEDLKKNGANPRNVGGADSETLVHLAVSKLDKPLLDFIINELGCSVADPTRTLLSTALDANPLPFHSAPDFWETVYYLLENDHIKVPSHVTKNSVVPTVTDLASPAYDLITGADPATLNEARRQVMLSNKPIEQLSSDVRSFRRRAAFESLINSNVLSPQESISNKNAILEIMIKYRGLDGLLSPREQSFFESTIRLALKNNMALKMPPQTEIRVAESLLDMVGTKTDYNFVKNTIDEIIKTYTQRNEARTSMWRGKQDLLERRWYRTPRMSSEVREQSLDSGVSIERATLFKELPFAKSLPDTESVFVPQIERQTEPFEPVAGPSGCGRFRRRRRSASNCLISKSEYDEFVKTAEENGKKVFMIDTEDFVKKADRWHSENEVKYRELIEIGQMLIDEKNARLDGDYGSLFEEKVKPRTVENYVHAEENPTINSGFAEDPLGNLRPRTSYESSASRTPIESGSSKIPFPEFTPLRNEFFPKGTYHDNLQSEVYDHQSSLSKETIFKPEEVIVNPHESGRFPVNEPSIHEPISTIHEPISTIPKPISTIHESISTIPEPISTIHELVHEVTIPRTTWKPLPWKPLTKFGSFFKGR